MDEDLEEEDEDGEDVGAGPGGGGEKFVRVLLRLPFVSMFLLPSLEAFWLVISRVPSTLARIAKITI